MRVAVACLEDGNVADFKAASRFGLFDIENGKTGLVQSIEVRKDWYMSVAEFLAEQEADAVICKNIGRGALSSFRAGGIKVYGGVEGSVNDAINGFIEGSLNFDPMAGMH